MRAVQLTAIGGPEVLVPTDVAPPRPLRADDVLVRVRAAGVSALDARQRALGTVYPLRMPSVPGVEGAGVVEAVGGSVARFRRGDPVYFFQPGFGDLPGAYGELCVVREALLARKPERLDFAEAACAPLSVLAAWEALFRRTRLQAGQTLLVHGGAGGVGHMALQLGRLAGARVATTVSTPEKAAFAESLGAHEAVFYREENFTLALLDSTDEAGVDVVLDTVGGEVFEHSFTALRLGGDLVTLLTPAARTNWTVARQRNLRIAFEQVLAAAYLGEAQRMREQGRILEQARRLFDQGRLRVHVHRVFPLDQAAQAHLALDDPGRLGKIALSVS